MWWFIASKPAIGPPYIRIHLAHSSFLLLADQTALIVLPIGSWSWRFLLHGAHSRVHHCRWSLLVDHHGGAPAAVPLAFRVVDRIFPTQYFLVMLRVLELGLREDVLEVCVALMEGTTLAMIFSIVINEALCFVHEGFTIVALRVLLHCHHG